MKRREGIVAVSGPPQVEKGLRGQERGRRGEEGQSEGAGAFPEGEKPCSVGHPVKEDGLLHRSTFTLLRIL